MQAMIEATLAGMKVVRKGQRNPVGTVEVKQGDGHNTVVTKWDKLSEQVMLSVLAQTGINVLSEEIGFVQNATGEQSLVFLVDPLDGSKPFAIGAPTSTVSIGLYYTSRQTVTAVVVGEPATGRVLYAREGGGTKMFWHDFAAGLISAEAQVLNVEQCRVSSGPFGPSGVTLVDCYHGFRLKDHPITLNAVWGRLMSALNEQGIVYNFGTNCGHHALVALGRSSVRGAITTCRGGPHDIAAGLLVAEAGGVTRCFSDKSGRLVEVGPLAVVEANFMVSAVSAEAAEELVQIFKTSIGVS